MNQEKLYQNALLLEQEKKYSQAVKIYKKIVSDSNDPRYFAAYGVALQKLKHWEQSVTILEKALSLKPHYGEGDLRLFLAESYLKSGKKKKAIEQWHVAEKMEPQYPSYEHVQNEAKNNLKKYVTKNA